MAIDLPVVVDKQRTINVGRGNALGRQDRLTAAVDAQSAADIKNLLIGLTVQDSDEQVKANNPPVRLLVDGKENKPLPYVRYKAEVQFGTTLTTAVVRAVEIEVANAIKRTTDAKTGTLQNVQLSWQWYFFDGPNASAQTVTNPAGLSGLTSGQSLVFAPLLDYVSFVNYRVSQSRGGGFIWLASDRLSSIRALRDFNVFGGYTVKQAAPGESWQYGSPCIVIKAQKGRARKRVRR